MNATNVLSLSFFSVLVLNRRTESNSWKHKRLKSKGPFTPGGVESNCAKTTHILISNFVSVSSLFSSKIGKSDCRGLLYLHFFLFLQKHCQTTSRHYNQTTSSLMETKRLFPVFIRQQWKTTYWSQKTTK